MTLAICAHVSQARACRPAPSCVSVGMCMCRCALDTCNHCYTSQPTSNVELNSKDSRCLLIAVAYLPWQCIHIIHNHPKPSPLPSRQCQTLDCDIAASILRHRKQVLSCVATYHTVVGCLLRKGSAQHRMS